MAVTMKSTVFWNMTPCSLDMSNVWQYVPPNYWAL
jgi:hypothetical protein